MQNQFDINTCASRVLLLNDELQKTIHDCLENEYAHKVLPLLNDAGFLLLSSDFTITLRKNRAILLTLRLKIFYKGIKATSAFPVHFSYKALLRRLREEQRLNCLDDALDAIQKTTRKRIPEAVNSLVAAIQDLAARPGWNARLLHLKSSPLWTDVSWSSPQEFDASPAAGSSASQSASGSVPLTVPYAESLNALLSNLRSSLLPQLDQSFLTLVQEHLAGLKQTAVPDNMVPANIVSCSFVLYCNSGMDLTLACTLTLQYSFQGSWTESVPCGNLTSLLKQGPKKPDAMLYSLEQFISEKAGHLEYKVLKSLFPFEVRSDPVLTGDSPEAEAARQLLQKGTVTCGHIRIFFCSRILSGQWVEINFPDGADTHILCSNSGEYVLAAATAARMIFPLPSPLREASGSLQDLTARIHVLLEAAEVYQTMANPDFPLPEVGFGLAENEIRSYTVHNLSYPVSTPVDEIMEHPAEWAGKLFEEIVREERNRAERDEQKRRATGNLNELQVKILQYIYADRPKNSPSRNVTKTLLLEEFGKDDLISGAAVERYVSLLLTTKIQYDGHQEYLVFTRKESNRYGEYDSLIPNPRIPRSFINGILPRPYRITDLPDMRPTARPDWLEQEAQRVLRLEATEAAWNLLTAAEQHISKTVMAAFVKSDTGQELLGKLKGMDRVYARLLLEELPGCKRLIRQILPEEPDSSEDTPDPEDPA